MILPERIVSILGEERAVERVYENGYTCPFCGYAVLFEQAPVVTSEGYEAHCGNPVCPAGPTTVAAARERIAAWKEERRRREEHEARLRAMDARIAWERERRAAELAEWRRLADEEGYCLECLSRTNGRRRVRHKTYAH